MDREMDRGKPYFGKLPCAIQSFEELRRGGYIYVDKTDLIWDIAHGAKVQFFARPRRFGKSLMISTLKSYFEGRGELFEGLKAEEKRRAAGETEWEKHPTFVFGFSVSSFTRKDNVYEVADFQLTPYENIYGLPHEGTIGVRLKAIIHAAHDAGGPKPVILVDEYDNPLTDTLAADRQDLHLHYKNELRGFYKAIKENAEMLHLVVITGITQFHDLSLFSGINQLRNKSFSPEFATLFGLTEEELVENFPDEITRLAQRYGQDFEGMVGMLREYYDGYRFTERDVHVYNPQSIIFALDEGKLENFWASTGTSSLMATVFPTYSYDFAQLMAPVESSFDELMRLDASGENPVPLLFQSGYLTIEDCSLMGAAVELRFPNREVRGAFWQVVLPLYGPRGTSTLIAPFLIRLERGDVAGAMERLEALIAGVAYSTMGRQQRPELYEELFRTALYAWFSALGVLVRTEVHSLHGRSDVEIYIGHQVIIFELKVGPMRVSARQALAQIEAQGYAAPHRGQGKSVVGVGLSIDTRPDTCGQCEWVSEEL
ncbi:MAG: hypothetical protein CSA07_04730 [Bacteroidia bacterium]|nr:MAG: hypothetical protein CSA07_04730 [Bacteroidia bacterium]